MIDKIKHSYLKSKKNITHDHKSLHWKKILDKKDFKNFENLSNFRNNGLSYGHDDSNYYDKKRFDYEIKLIIKKIGIEFLKNNLKKKNIGNLKNLYSFNNSLIDPGDIHLINFLYEIDKHIFKKIKIKNICEIGGGYGGLAEKVLLHKTCRYLLIDLPETNILSTYYLYKNFPKKRILTYADLKSDYLSKKKIEEYDIVILPPNVNLEDIKFELFINTRSMMEMRMSVINKYFKIINNQISADGFFYNVNRYIKFRSGEPIFLKNYPYGKGWKLIDSSKSFNQNWIHQLITQKTNDSSDAKMKKELQKISRETKKFLKPDEIRYINNNYLKKKNPIINLCKILLYKIGIKILGKKYYKYKQLVYKILNKIS